MTELTETEQKKLSGGLQARAIAETLLPYLSTRTAACVGRIVGAFRSGKPDEVFAIAAELSALSDMKADFLRKINEAKQLEEKAYGKT